MNAIRLDKSFKQIALLGLMTAFALSLVAMRVVKTQHPMYLFYVWNLFLAWVPLFFSTLALRASQSKRGFGLGLLLLVPWLLFLPNAPYLITDLIHLRPRHAVPYWYDVILNAVFVFSGIMAGLLSMQQVQQMLQKRIRRAYTWVIMALVALASGYGIYLGRVLRYNSWDILQHPFRLFQDIIQPFLHPFSNKEGLLMSMALGVFFFLAYLCTLGFGMSKPDEPALPRTQG